MDTEDDHGLNGLVHQNSEFVNPQINDDPLYEHQNFEFINPQINYDPRDDNEDPLTNLRLKGFSRSTSSDSDENGRSKSSRPSSESNSEDGELLGLTLNKTPSFMNLLEAQLSEGKMSSTNSPQSSTPLSGPPPPRRVGRPTRKNASGNKSKMDDFTISSEKLKASNFPAIKFQVGEWERISKYEGDLIAKCYYAKRKLVWEILDGPLKNKIEIQWSDIIAIRAFTPRGEHPGVLEIELNQPPILFRETNPQPRKHTLWQQTTDFTGGQVSIHRRHCVKFPPGVLDKHYEKLLGFDSRLNELSKKPFPSMLCPYFETYNPHEVSDFLFDNHYGPQSFTKMHYPFHFSTSSSSLSALIPNVRQHNKSAMAAEPLRQFSSSFPVSGGGRSDSAHINQKRVLWGDQGSNNLMNVAFENQTFGMLPGNSTTSPQANWVVPTQDHHLAMYPQNDSMENNQVDSVLDYIKDHLLNDNQVASFNETVDSMYPLLEQHGNGSLDATGDVHGLNSGYQTMNNYAQAVAPNDGMTYAEPLAWIFPQETSQIPMLGQTMEHSANPYYPTLDPDREV